ncbi:MAG TPA: ribosome small subunit-dependent GTPase A [Armatimonadota bacterium]|nr:ribosome small subunit-dependent GTPase A [Armatimonadota bacterium]
MNLARFGWNDRLAAAFQEYSTAGRVPIRISLRVRGHYLAFTEAGEMPALPTGRLKHGATTSEDLPVVGDWVAATILEESTPRAQIHAVLPRTSLFCRKEAGGRAAAQPIAANVDIVFVAVALDNDFSLNRIERYLALSRESGACPVVLLTKSDACADSMSRTDEVRARMPDVPVFAISSINGIGIAALDEYLRPGVTCALLGSSGVGKSTLVNHLLGAEVQKTREVRFSDSKGRHATAHRQMFVLPSGALVIDTPGMRELQLWDAEGGLDATFSDIAGLSSECRFPDCTHTAEPGCAVLEALDAGRITRERLENYRKMRKELGYLSRRMDEGAARLERARWKAIAKEQKRMKNT